MGGFKGSFKARELSSRAFSKRSTNVQRTLIFRGGEEGELHNETGDNLGVVQVDDRAGVTPSHGKRC